MITAAPLALTLTRLTRCVTVSVPLAQLSLVTRLGKMDLIHWRRSRVFSPIRHHCAVLTGPGRLGVIAHIAHDAAAVKS